MTARNIRQREATFLELTNLTNGGSRGSPFLKTFKGGFMGFWKDLIKDDSTLHHNEETIQQQAAQSVLGYETPAINTTKIKEVITELYIKDNPAIKKFVKWESLPIEKDLFSLLEDLKSKMICYDLFVESLQLLHSIRLYCERMKTSYYKTSFMITINDSFDRYDVTFFVSNGKDDQTISTRIK